METPHSEGNQHQSQSSKLLLCINKRYKLKIVQVHALKTSYSDEDINNVYNDIDETLGKLNHYTIVSGDFNDQIGKRTNLMDAATGQFGLGLRNKRSDTLVEWATSRKYKIMKSSNGVTKTEIEYILTNRRDIVI